MCVCMRMRGVHLHWLVCMCTTCMYTHPRGGQKGESALELQEVVSCRCGCWETKPGPLEEQQVHFTAKSCSLLRP